MPIALLNRGVGIVRHEINERAVGIDEGNKLIRVSCPA